MLPMHLFEAHGPLDSVDALLFDDDRFRFEPFYFIAEKGMDEVWTELHNIYGGKGDRDEFVQREVYGPQSGIILLTNDDLNQTNVYSQSPRVRINSYWYDVLRMRWGLNPDDPMTWQGPYQSVTKTVSDFFDGTKTHIKEPSAHIRGRKPSEEPARQKIKKERTAADDDRDDALLSPADRLLKAPTPAQLKRMGFKGGPDLASGK